ncbi:MAG TPA: hypothetical protein P5513_06170 [Candidatus Diapherotrites archaeon]|nr:hypothetical protein [Candidatus Diapherotrites archaeon]
MFKKILNNIKVYTLNFISFILVICLFIFIFFIVYMFLKQNKKIQIIPEFKIIDAQEFDVNTTEQTIELCKEILQKVKTL